MRHLPVAILCGGRGTRLGALTSHIPKSMVRVNGRPFIHWQLDLLHKRGYNEVLLCIGYLGSQIEDAIGDGKNFGMWIEYSRDGVNSLGTGGAIKHAIPDLGKEFMVLYGDSYLDCAYSCIETSFHFGMSKSGLITTYNHVPYGLGIFKESAFDGFSGRFDLNEVYQALALRDDLKEFTMFRRWYEIGSPQGLEETCRHIASSTYPTSGPFSTRFASTL